MNHKHKGHPLKILKTIFALKIPFLLVQPREHEFR